MTARCRQLRLDMITACGYVDPNRTGFNDPIHTPQSCAPTARAACRRAHRAYLNSTCAQGATGGGGGGGITGGGGGGGGGIFGGGRLGSIPGMGTLSSAFSGPLIRFQKDLMGQQFKAIQRMEDNFVSLDSVNLEYNNTTGQMNSNMGQSIGMAYDAVDAFEKYGSVTQRMSRQLRGAIKDQSELVKGQMAMARGYSRLQMEESRYEQSMASAVVMMEKLGISTTTSTAIMDTQARSHGLGAQKIMDDQMEMISVAQALGKSNSEVAEDFRSAQNMMAYDATKSMSVFKGMQAVSKATGIEQAALNDTFGQSMDTFDGAASVAGRLNAALGTQINATELLRADEHERMMIIRQAFEDSGRSVEDLTGRTGKFFRDMLGDAMGSMSRDEVGRFFRMNVDEYKIHMDRMQQSANQFQPYGTKGNIEAQVDILANAYRKRLGIKGRAELGALGILDARVDRTFDTIDTMMEGQSELFRKTIRQMDTIDRNMTDGQARMLNLINAYGANYATITGLLTYGQRGGSLSTGLGEGVERIGEVIGTTLSGMETTLRTANVAIGTQLAGLARVVAEGTRALNAAFQIPRGQSTDNPMAYNQTFRLRSDMGLFPDGDNKGYFAGNWIRQLRIPTRGP